MSSNQSSQKKSQSIKALFAVSPFSVFYTMGKEKKKQESFKRTYWH